MTPEEIREVLDALDVIEARHARYSYAPMLMIAYGFWSPVWSGFRFKRLLQYSPAPLRRLRNLRCVI